DVWPLLRSPVADHPGPARPPLRGVEISPRLCAVLGEEGGQRDADALPGQLRLQVLVGAEQERGRAARVLSRFTRAFGDRADEKPQVIAPLVDLVRVGDED